MSPPKKDEQILTVSESYKITLDGPKLRAMVFAVITGLAGWFSHDMIGHESTVTVNGVTRKEWEDHQEWSKTEVLERNKRLEKADQRLERIEEKVDQLLLRLVADRNANASEPRQISALIP